MFALIMGHRRGISKALEELGVPFGIWNSKSLVNNPKTDFVVIGDFETSKEPALAKIKDFPKITHIIAGSEEAVVPASQLRIWTGAQRNPHSTIIRCSDKLKMKQYLSEKNIPMTDYLDSKTNLSPEAIFQKIGTPIIAKKRFSSGGRMMERVKDQAHLTKILKNGYILEKAIKGTEGSVESFVQDGEILFENITRYVEVGSINLVPCDYESRIQEEIRSLNRKVIEALKIKWGMTHLEFYITEEGVLFGEVAIRPPGGYIMNDLALAYGIDSWKCFVEVELGMRPKIVKQDGSFSASIVIPKKKGVVKSINGVTEIKALSSLKKLKLKVDVGDEVAERLGVGDEMGYALFQSQDQVLLLRDIASFGENLNICVE